MGETNFDILRANQFIGGTPLNHPFGNFWYVDGNQGNNKSGRAPNKAFLTMAEAFDHIKSGDVICVRGNIREQLTTPAGVFDVTIVGAGNRPRHADEFTGHDPYGGFSTATWKAPAAPAATTPLLKIQQQGWRISYILWAGPTDAYCVQLYRDGGTEHTLERDASHAEFIGNRFASGQGGINDTGGCYGVLLDDNRFLAMTDFAVKGVGNIGVGQSAWQVFRNQINGCVNGVKIAAFGCVLKGNYFDDGETPNTTTVLNTNNGGGANNFVVDNYFQTTSANFNTPDIVGCATDVWNNTSIDGQDISGGGASIGREVGQPA